MATVLLIALATALQHHGHEQQHHDPQHSFTDTEQWIEAFENAERDAQQKPDDVVRALKLSPGEAVADIGTGTGYFTRRLARAVGDDGIAYAVDIEPNMLRYVAERALREGQPNIVPVLATASSPMLAPSSVDLVFICNTIHHIDARGDYYRILARILRRGGRLAIVDFHEDAELEDGPSKEMRIAKQSLIDEISAAGFRLVEEHDFLPVQYFLIFDAPAD
ncbi:MAG TPA: methyltransferase domain-containing protein [Vicinamibacteria bacterium]|nr:methyltransferase domain-containing protein [Vicinamibacteria bacterium]